MAPSRATKIELTTAPPEVKRIGPDDLKAALRAGLADFMAKPSGMEQSQKHEVGHLVGALPAAASRPLFVGLAVVMPTLGHATWHLYRRVVMPAEGGDQPASGRPRSQGAVGP